MLSVAQVEQTAIDDYLDEVDKADGRIKADSYETEVGKSEGRIGSKKHSIFSIHVQFEGLNKHADVIQQTR